MSPLGGCAVRSRLAVQIDICVLDIVVVVVFVFVSFFVQ